MPVTRTLEECSVDGVGKFTAFSDGSLRVVFTDRTCLDLRGLHWQPHVYSRLLAHNVVSVCSASDLFQRLGFVLAILALYKFVRMYVSLCL